MEAEPMSPRDRTDHVTLLRGVIARIERGAPAPLGPGGASLDRSASGAAIPLGLAGFGFDRLLGGGLRRGALHEIAPAGARDEGAASRFALAVAACGLGIHGAVVWIIDDCAARESGAPYRPGLQTHGLDPDRLIVVRTRGAHETLWAAEEALRGSGLFVLIELWAGRHYGLAPSRRLVLAARARGGTGILVHAGLGAGARTLSTSCETRLVVAAHPSRHGPAASGGVPVPGAPAFAVRLDKVRGAAGIDPQRLHPLHWNETRRCFHDPDHPVAVAAPPADRPAGPRRRGAR